MYCVLCVLYKKHLSTRCGPPLFFFSFFFGGGGISMIALTSLFTILPVTVKV